MPLEEQFEIVVPAMTGKMVGDDIVALTHDHPDHAEGVTGLRARCGAALSCDPAGDCWCKHVEVRLPMPAAGEGCLCAACLREAANA